MLLRAVEISPNEGHCKYMYLGQIHSGQEAVDYYNKGIEILLSVLEKEPQTTVSTMTIYYLLGSVLTQFFQNLYWSKTQIFMFLCQANLFKHIVNKNIWNRPQLFH